MPQSYRPLDYHLSFAVPHRLTEVESWHQHTPFASALVTALQPRVLVELGTHRGDSYCTFCQAVDALGLPTRCYAVDTWQGDEHSGHYGDEVYEDLRAYHDPRYGRFSTLLRSTFDQAREHFPDGSVDLLHIDGLHTEEAVRHDFENWLPKLSERGVVLFHDSNVRERDFGVWRFWQQVAERYPSFEFPHGHGLGLLAVGSEVPAEVLDLCALSGDERQRIIRLYQALGERVLYTRQVASLRVENERRSASLAEKEQLVARRDERIRSLEQALRERDEALRERDDASREQARVRVEQEARVVDLEAQLAFMRREVEGFVYSRSWRLTAPLRWLVGVARRRGSRASRGPVPGSGEPSQDGPAELLAVDRAARPLLATGAMNGGWYGGEEIRRSPHGRPSIEESRLAAKWAERMDAADTQAILEYTGSATGAGDQATRSAHGGAPSALARSLAPLQAIEGSLSKVRPDGVPARADGPPSFTLVTPFFRHYRHFEACAASVLELASRSQGLPFEWLVLNDDPSFTVADLERAIPERLRSVTRVLSDGRNHGIVKRLNQGIQAARNEWILFLDCDDLIGADAIPVLDQYISRYPRCRYISSAMLDIAESGEVLRYRRRTSGPSRLLTEGMTAGHLKAVRRDAFEQHGLLDEAFDGCQDYEFALRMAFAEPLLYIPEYLYSYRWHRASQSVGQSARQTATADAVVRRYASMFLSRSGNSGRREPPQPESLLPQRAIAIVRTQGNRSDLLQEALHSLQVQQLPVTAVVVVHGDADALRRVEGLVASTGGGVQLLHAPDTKRRRGYPLNVALRQAYESAEGPGFLFFLDDDDVVYPMFAQKMYEALTASGADLVCCASNRRMPGQAAQPGYSPLPAPCLLVQNFIPINSYAVRFSALASRRLLFSEELEYLEDWDFLVRALGEGLRFHALEDTLCEFRLIGDGNRPVKARPDLWAKCEKQVRREAEGALLSLGGDRLMEQLLAFPADLLARLSASDLECVMAARSLVEKVCPAPPEEVVPATGR